MHKIFYLGEIQNIVIILNLSTVIWSGICKQLSDQTNMYLIWFLFLWNYNDLFTELRPALLKFCLTKENFACHIWPLCTFRKDFGLHCANFTKLKRDPSFNLKGVSNGFFVVVGANSLIVKMWIVFHENFHNKTKYWRDKSNKKPLDGKGISD